MRSPEPYSLRKSSFAVAGCAGLQESLESGSPLPYLVTIDALQRRFDLRHGVRVLFGSLGWLSRGSPSAKASPFPRRERPSPGRLAPFPCRSRDSPSTRLGCREVNAFSARRGFYSLVEIFQFSHTKKGGTFGVHEIVHSFSATWRSGQWGADRGEESHPLFGRAGASSGNTLCQQTTLRESLGGAVFRLEGVTGQP